MEHDLLVAVLSFLAPRELGPAKAVSCAWAAAAAAALPESFTRHCFLSLAVHYGVQPTAIKRINNMISDHSLHSRIFVHVPVAFADDLVGRAVQVRYCQAAKRDVAVLLEDGDACCSSDWEAYCGREAELQAEQLREKMSKLLGRSMRVDKETALFYIDEAGGDLKRAMSSASKDASWEDTTLGPIRTAPLQRWISGDAGL
ncbi:F-box protein [Monoraphidium neglectum]|uniref:F-box protein n=1 Tax=Monoraphidium neglectum TaxID=145388 RepID=A0A0D2LN81_9CHLO|nr:F-box protein [Monoraphidium neglectum]KIZ07719.1 F-box protein [Monoraphidium neglectum]|eukprot:XP_013906738.1 F-box protein [Monoraphidium neglectum]